MVYAFAVVVDGPPRAAGRARTPGPMRSREADGVPWTGQKDHAKYTPGSGR